MSFIYYLLLAVIAFLAGLYVYGTWTFNHFKKHNFPYTKRLVPFFGTMGQFVIGRTSLGCLTKDIYDEFRDSKLVGLFEFRNPTIMVRDPELIKQVTIKDFEYFTEKKNHRSVPFTEEVEPLLSKSLLGLDGDAWKDLRATLSPAFTTSKMKGMFRYIQVCGDQLCNYIENKVQAQGSGVYEVEIKDLFSRYANDVIATAAFGIEVDSLKYPDNDFYDAGKEMFDFGGVKALIFFGYRISAKIMKILGISVFSKKARELFVSVIDNTLERREKENIVRPDLLQLMMESRKTVRYDDQGEKIRHSCLLTNEDITAQSIFIYAAAFDTSSSNICWLTNLVAIHTDVQIRLRDEIDATLLRDGEINYENIAGMKYLDMCVNEAMRLWPPTVVTNRSCTKDYTFPASKNCPAFTVKKGEGLWIPLMGIHRDPEYFPEPDKFDPERFSDERKDEIQPFTYMPFGTGPRNCLGRRFALMETKIAIVEILRKFELIKSWKTTLSSMTEMQKASFNMIVEGGFWVKFKSRTDKKMS